MKVKYSSKKEKKRVSELFILGLKSFHQGQFKISDFLL